MKISDMSRKRISEHYERYPKMQIADAFKFIFQSSFGCEHLVSDEECAIERIRREYIDTARRGDTLVDRLDGEYSRVHLSYLDSGLSATTLGKLFCMSAKKEPCGKEELQRKLLALRELITDGVLPFALESLERELDLWEKQGYPAVHHSENFRFAYSPSYRVVANEYVRFLPLLAEIDKRLESGRAIVAIEGGSASGKTTLSRLIEKIYDCNVFHMDDFFLRPEQRCAERFSEVGGNVDRERFYDEVLLPLSRSEDVSYRRFDCGTQTILEPVVFKSKRLTVVEGAYSMHQDLAPFYDFSVFLDISPEYQTERIKKRNSTELAKRFFEEWIPLEKIYFSKTDITSRCALTLKIEKEL